MAVTARPWGDYTYYKVEDPADTWVGVDAARPVREGDLVVVETPQDHHRLVGEVHDPHGEPRLITACRCLYLKGHALLGVVALVVSER